MRKTILMLLAVLTVVSASAASQPKTESTHDAKMAWWREARFGMFVHWGPYSLYGCVYNGQQSRRFGSAWIMNICKIPVREYRAMASTFNPQPFNADSLILTAKRTGMRYVVLTAKHHDGFAMFQSDASHFNIKDYTHFGRDVVDELAAACRRHDMKLGLYYSHNLDWNNPGGTCDGKPASYGVPNPDSVELDRYMAVHNRCWDPIQHSASPDAYFERVAIPQVQELLGRYGDQLAVLWWDTPKGVTPQAARKLDSLVRRYPHLITNNRLHPTDYPGDYTTPERYVPKREDIVQRDWETCTTIGSSWGYKSWDKNYKKPEKLIRELVTVVSRGGNYLLNVGPDAQGQLAEAEGERLQRIGAWMTTNSEAIYGGQRTEFEVAWGACIRRDTPQGVRYYLGVFGRPDTLQICVPLRGRVRGVQRLDNGRAVPFVCGKEGLTVNLDGQHFDPAVTMLRVVMN